MPYSSPSTQAQGTTPAALHTLLSQLSFTAEIPASQGTAGVEDELNVLNGLFCLNFEEGADDLYFDAQQDINSSDTSQDQQQQTADIFQDPITDLRGGDSSGE